MQGANGSVFGCGLCRRTKGIGIWKLPVAKYEAHGKWRDEWLGKIKKTREMDQNFSGQSKSDAIYTCEKQLRLKISKYVSIHVCTLVFVKLSDLLWTGFSSIFRSVLLMFEVRSQCGYGFSFDQLEVSWQFYPFFDRSPCEMTKKKPKFGALPKLNMPTKSYERGKPYSTSWTFGCKM